MDSFILCGMQYGDEGKGTFVDYLVHEKNIDCVVKYNGGSQASHTVITPEGKIHKFSQLGSGMFKEDCHTYITENMVINIDNLMVELEVFSKKTGISISNLLERIHIHENCYIVTPYHKLINKLRELSKGNERRGTVGTGVSEVKFLLLEPKKFPYEQPLGIQIKDVFDPYSNNPIIGKMRRFQEYVENFYYENKDKIQKHMPRQLKEKLNKEIDYLLANNAYAIVASDYVTSFKFAPEYFNLRKCIYNTYELSFRKEHEEAIFEGSQGILIDGTYGIKPNTTFLDTTNNFAMDIAYFRDDITKIGIAKAFTSRHGPGIFPTESEYLRKKISDENQEETFWNGKIRFGWFDVVLFKYAQRINQVDELYLSSLDKLSNLKNIKICERYIYYGIVDQKFKDIFVYHIENEMIIITDIKRNDDDLINYLKKCEPDYIYMKGWETDISKVTKKCELPKRCIEYIYILKWLIKVPITVVSVGPTRNNKIRIE